MNKRTSVVIMSTLLLAGAVFAAEKNEPSKDEVEKALEKAGKPHFYKRTKIRPVGAVKVDTAGSETYFHIFNVYIKDRADDVDENRAVIFDNKKNYLGYYPTYDLEVSDVEEGAFIIEVEMADDGDDDDGGGGDADLCVVQIPPEGPQKNANINGVGTRFITAPEPEKKEGEAEIDNANKPKYREWTLSANGQSITVSALYIRVEGDEVFLKSEAKGAVKGFKLYMLSPEDKEYVKERLALEKK